MERLEKPELQPFEWTPPATADELYARVRRFQKGQPVPRWVKRIEPREAGDAIIFARDCEVLWHGANGCTIWPIVPLKRNEPRMFFEAKMSNGQELLGDCEFFMTVRS